MAWTMDDKDLMLDIIIDHTAAAAPGAGVSVSAPGAAAPSQVRWP